jgi:hypothetical protein
MRTLISVISVATTILGILLCAAAAHAQATRTWVSGVGDDANPCSRTAPCKTFAGAISKTAKDGEISVLDPGGFGAVTITKSITINGTPGSGYGSILAALTNGIIINITNATDIRKTVRLRWLDINGASTGLNGIRIIAANTVIVDNTNIDGFTNRGISDERSAAGKLFVSNTTISNAGTGVVTVGTSSKLDLLLDNVRLLSSDVGASLTTNGTRAIINRSVIAGNALKGVSVSGTAEASISNTIISQNPIGIEQVGSGVIRLSNSDNGWSDNTALSGQTFTFGNNRLFGYGGLGTAPTAMGADSHDKGQQ